MTHRTIEKNDEKCLCDEIFTDPFYSDSNMAYLRRGVEAINNGEGTEHDIIDADE